MPKSPYKFLDSYSKEDREIFFGRDKEIEEVHSRVFESKTLIVYGTSGTGKSSLINCGLANKFNDSDWLPVNIRRGININLSLFECLDKIVLTTISSGNKVKPVKRKNDIVRIIQSIYLDHFKPLYLIFDQFEELFIFGNNEEKDELISGIKKVLDSDLQCRFIFCIREEYLACLTEFERIIPSFLSNRIRIEKMQRQNAIQVIEGPCLLNNIGIEPGFPEMLLEKLNPDSPDIELTYLQVYLDKVFHLASRQEEAVNSLTKDLLIRCGEVKDLLGTFLEEQISKFDDPESGMVILKAFVSAKGTRHQISEDEVIEYSKTLGKDIDRNSIKGMLQKFISLRIIRDKDENGRYELRHDSLASKIYEKITLVEKEMLEVRQFLEYAYNSYEKRQLLLTSEDLNYIAPYEERLFLNEKLLKLISQSKWSIHRKKRRRQNVFISTFLIIIAVLSFFTIWAIKERNNAIDQQHFADEQRNSSIKAKIAADSARQIAVISKNLAIEKENQALRAQQQSEDAKKEAFTERENALGQKNRAENMSKIAIEQAAIAKNEKLTADQERLKAFAAEQLATQLSLLSTAQNLALKSTGFEKDPELMGLLAVQAFLLNKKNGGRTEDPIIYEALDKAYSTLDSSRHTVFTGSANEIWILRGRNDGFILSADLDGRIRQWSKDGIENRISDLSFRSPINYIGSSPTGERLVTQHDNNDLLLWNKGLINTDDPAFQELKGHSGYVRTSAFSADEKFMATAARDSSVIIWDLTIQPALKVAFIKNPAQTRAMVFCNSDTLIMVQEDGSFILRNIRHDQNTILYMAEREKPLSLCWNNSKKVLIAGCSNGNLMLFDLSKSINTQPVKYSVHTSGIDLIAFNPDFSLMATSSWDKTIKLYDYNDFFGLNNSISGEKHIRDLDSRIRSLTFTADNKLAAGLSDRSIRIWETSSGKLALLICELVKRDMTAEEWNKMAGSGIPYESTCGKSR
jgi:hypothetical protein